MQGKPYSETIALALGSNLGDRLAVLRSCLAELKPYFAVEKKSAIYETPPAYVLDQPAYLNAAVVGRSRLRPLDLLRALKQTETDLGREESFRYGPRLIDIDILFYRDHRIVLSELAVPHPRLAEREFVLRPLAEIAGDWRHPETGQTVQAMLAALPVTTARRIEESF